MERHRVDLQNIVEFSKKTRKYAEYAIAAANNAGGTGELSIVNETASFIFALDDANKLIRQTSASATNATVPPNADVAFPIGTQIHIANSGAGQVTIVAGTGVTINSAGGALKLRVQYSMATLIKIATNTWLLTGDITT